MIFQESENVELKSIIVEDIRKVIISFANCDGGKLYIGVQNDGTVTSIDNPDNTALQVSNMVRDAIKPDLTMFLHYETLDIEGKKIVAVDVQRGTQRPYYIAKKGLRPEGVYVRQGYSSVPATDTIIRHMIKETDGNQFEEMRSLEQNLTFETAKKEFTARNLPLGSAQMKTLGIINQDDVYTNLGLLLSDQCIHTIKAAVFEGTNQNQFKDRKEFSGSLFKQMQEVYDYLDFRNQIHSTFEKLYRIDQRDYPVVAVREALLNLLVHREYAFRASTFISMYSDRIEFTSIGGLVSGVTQKDITMGISVCRNIKLANVFYRLELIEAYGTGIRKIFDAYDGTGKDPQIEVSDNAFKIVLPNINTVPETWGDTLYESPSYSARYPMAESWSIRPPQMRPDSAGRTISPHPVCTETGKHPDGITGPHGDTGKVIALIRERNSITRKEVQTLLEIGQTTAGRLLKKMTDQGQIIQKGRGKNTHYCLPEHFS